MALPTAARRVASGQAGGTVSDVSAARFAAHHWREAIRCLKRHLSNLIYRQLMVDVAISEAAMLGVADRRPVSRPDETPLTPDGGRQ